MSSVIARINNSLHALTPSEAKAAEYCRLHPDQVISTSINEIARLAGVSVASVSRLASTLGYRDWKDMRLSLARDSHGDNPIYAEIDSGDPDQEVVKKVFDGNIASLRDTYAQLDKRGLVKVMNHLKKTDRVVFFGSGGSGFMALDEGLRFSHLDLSADTYTDEYTMMIQASKMKKGQIAFGFSHSGRTRALIAALAEAKSRQAFTVGIANFRGTPLEEVADVFFCATFPRPGALTASLTGRLALLSIMDSLYVLAAQHGRMGPNSERINKIIETNLRFSSRRHPEARKGKK